MTKRWLWLATVLAAGMLAFAWAGGPSPKGPAGDGQGSQSGTAAQVRSQVETQAQAQVQAQVQSTERAAAPAPTAEGPRRDGAAQAMVAGDKDQIRDRLHQQLQDGSCLDTTAALAIPTGDQDPDQIRDRLHDGSCDGDSCQDYDYDHDYDYAHDYSRHTPPPEGGYGPR